MARGQRGDKQAYHRLLAEITPYLRSLARGQHRLNHDVDDAVQDVLLSIHAVRQTYDPARPFGPWLHVLATRRLTDRLRKHGRTTVFESPLERDHDTIPAQTDMPQDEQHDRRLLRDAVKRLPKSQRDAVTLLKLQELSLEEASSRSGMTVSSLKAGMNRAIKSLRDLLGGTP